MPTTKPTLVDLSAKKRDWLREIEDFEKQNSKQSNIIIQAQQAMQLNEKEIAKRKQWIAFSSEIMGEDIAPPQSVETSTPVIGSEQAPFVNLPQWIMSILDSTSNKTFLRSELKELILKAGYKTSSPNFDNILFNTLDRLTKSNRVHMIKEGHKNKYRSVKDKSESFLE